MDYEKNLPEIYVDFLKDTREEMENLGVEVHLYPNMHIELPGGMEVNGLFVDSPEAMLGCSIGKPIEDWIPIYIHEYCHFTQWVEDSLEWRGVWSDPIYYDEFLSDWLNGKEDFRKSIVDPFIDAEIAVEADCERRAVALIQKRGLPLDSGRYAQQANSYIHFYNYVRLNRTWYEKGKEPYMIEEVWSQFPSEIDVDFPISWEYMDLFEKHCR